MNSQKRATVYWWAVLVASVGMSSYANVRHADLVAPDSDVAAWTAGLLPFALLVMVEGLALANKAGVIGVRRRLATGGIVVLAIIVLVASYVGVLSTVRETGLAAALPWLEFGLAGVPDLLMIFSTMYVMGLRASTEPDTSTSSPSAWSRIGGNVLARVEQATAPTPTSSGQPARPNTSDELVDQTVIESIDRPIELPSSELGEVADRPIDRPIDHDRPTRSLASSTGVDLDVHPDDRPDEVTDTGSVDRSTEVSTDPDEKSVEELAELVNQHSLTSIDRPIDLVDRAVALADETPVDWVAVAKRVRSNTSITAEHDELARVLEMDAAGATRAEIAESVGRAKSTVSGWIKVAASVGTVREEVSA